jgi:hypothetical protein
MKSTSAIKSSISIARIIGYEILAHISALENQLRIEQSRAKLAAVLAAVQVFLCDLAGSTQHIMMTHRKTEL